MYWQSFKECNISSRKSNLFCLLTAVLLSMLVQKTRGEKENNFQKNPNFAQIFFLQWFCHKIIERIYFQKSIMKNQLKMIFPKEYGFPSRKGSNILTLFYRILRFDQKSQEEEKNTQTKTWRGANTHTQTLWLITGPGFPAPANGGFVVVVWSLLYDNCDCFYLN